MFGFPPLPPFEGMHPLVVHFPIGILMIAWVPMVLGLVDKKRRSGWFLSGLMLLVVGTAFAFGAVLTGEATEEVVEHSSQIIEDAIHEHEETAELARNLFIAVTVVYIGALITVSKIRESKKKKIGLIAGLLIVVTYGYGVMTLANAGHQGGLLVHDLGVHAPIGTAAPVNTPVLQDGDHDDLEADD